MPVVVPGELRPLAEAPPSALAERMPHLAALTGLRFFAALWVLLYHIEIASHLPLPAVASIGYAGVSFFFVLSGFILAYTYLDVQGHLRGTRWGFWRARAARIYPLYAVAYLIATGPSLWLHLSAAPLALAGLAALVLLQSWLPWCADIWNGPGWSLSAEAFFYGLFPFMVRSIGGLGRRGLIRLGLASWLLTIAVPVIYVALNPDHLHSWGWGDGVWIRVLRFDPLVRLPEFVMGVMLGRMFVTDRYALERVGRSNSGLWAWLAAVSLVAIVALPVTHVPLPYVLLHNGLLDPFFAIIIYGMAWRRGWLARLLGSAWIVRLGQASYALYIIHVPVLLWLVHLTVAPSSGGIGPVCYWMIALSLCIGLALGAHCFIEEPARRRLRAG